MTRPRLWLSWSSGKDSAWALHVLRQEGRYEIAGLLTTLNGAAERVAMHAVRERLLDRQAEAAGLPLQKVALPSPCSNEDYERSMRGAIDTARAENIAAIAFGDLFLADVRAYREHMMAATGIAPVFPLWNIPTRDLARAMIAGGLQARITCVDPRQVPAVLAGRAFDESLLADLPGSADPCGENGEFHTFAHAGPMFARPVHIAVGETVERDGFVFTDLTPA